MVAVNRVMKTVAEKLANTLSDKKEAIDNLQNQLLAQWKQLGVPSIGGGLSIEARARSLADRLYANNITDISKLRLGSKEIEETVDVGEGLTQVQKTPREFLQYDGRQIGFLGNADDGGRNADPTGYLQPGGLASWTAAGKGAVGYTAKAAPNGQVYFIPSWGSTSDLSTVAPLVGLGLMFVPGLQGVGASLGTALGASGTAAAALGNAIIQGTLAEATGGDFLKGAAAGALGSYVPGVQSEIAGALGGGAAANVAAGALTGGAMSELTGGDFAQGALIGGIGSGINQAKLSAAEDVLQNLPGPGYDVSTAPTEVDILEAMGQKPSVNVSDFPVQDFGVAIDVNTPFYTQTGASAYVPNQDGTATYTWDDGSTITVDPSFNVVSFTNAIDSAFKTPEEKTKDISGKLKALDAAKAIAPTAVQALTAGALVNKIADNADQSTGFPILPVPSDWRSPEYNMAFTPSAPINFGSPAMLQETQWANPINLSSVINTLNQPVIAPETQQMMTQFQAPEVPYTTGINDIIGNLGDQPVSIADIISGIQSGQNYSS